MTDKKKPSINGLLMYYNSPDIFGDKYPIFQDKKYVTEDGYYLTSGIHSIGDGDRLTVFNDAAKKKTVWSGTIKFEKGRKTPNGIHPNTWRSFFKKNLPATLKKKM